MTQSNDQFDLRRVLGQQKLTFVALAAGIVATMVRDATGWGWLNALIALCFLGVIASQFMLWRARGGRVWALALGVVVTLGLIFGVILLLP